MQPCAMRCALCSAEPLPARAWWPPSRHLEASPRKRSEKVSRRCADSAAPRSPPSALQGQAADLTAPPPRAGPGERTLHEDNTHSFSGAFPGRLAQIHLPGLKHSDQERSQIFSEPAGTPRWHPPPDSSLTKQGKGGRLRRVRAKQV